MDATRGRTTVVGVFEDQEQLQQAVDELRRSGFGNDQIGVALHQGDTTGATFEVGETASGEGAATGAVTGGLIGGVLGAVAVGLIPGIGPVLAAGALAGVLGGAALGAAAGGVLGALAGMGIPEEEARYYDQEFQAGRNLLTVRTDDRYDQAHEILNRHGAYDIESRGRAATSAAPTDVDSSGGARSAYAPPRGMDRDVGEVPDVDRGTGMTSESPTSGGTFVQHTESGEPVVHDPSRIDRDVHESTTYNVGSTETGAVRPGQPGGGLPIGYDEEMPRYRSRWQDRYGNSGERWEDYEPGYRYGYEMSRTPHYQGRSFAAVEPELRDDWERTHPDTPWERASRAIKDAWEDVTNQDEDDIRRGRAA